jgi:hypothetical protein
VCASVEATEKIPQRISERCDPPHLLPPLLWRRANIGRIVHECTRDGTRYATTQRTGAGDRELVHFRHFWCLIFFFEISFVRFDSPSRVSLLFPCTCILLLLLVVLAESACTPC